MFQKLRDLAYDTVFHVGDTALQFAANLLRGPDDARHEKYANRQIDSVERRRQSELQKGERPAPSLQRKERKIFGEMLRRQKNESAFAHYKRSKTLLDYPNKHELIDQYKTLTGQTNAYAKHSGDSSKKEIEAKQKALEANFETIQTARLRQSKGQKP